MSLVNDRELVGRLFPQLSLDRFEPLGSGWTCDTYRVDGWIVQLPRTPYADAKLRRQMEVLPELGREVSAPVPQPDLVSLDPVCMGYREIVGIGCDTVGDVAAGDAGMWPERLGRFLYDLHMVPPEFLGMRGTSADALRGARYADWERLRDLASEHLTAVDARVASHSIEPLFEDDAVWRFGPCVTHGDLAPEHVLLTPSGDLAGVIDWEEVDVGDPAADFAWGLRMPGAGERALGAYGGPPDVGFAKRAGLCDALIPLHEVEHGLEAGSPGLVDAGLSAFHTRIVALGEAGALGP